LGESTDAGDFGDFLTFGVFTDLGVKSSQSSSSDLSRMVTALCTYKSKQTHVNIDEK
jgi:hypothetical protein